MKKLLAILIYSIFINGNIPVGELPITESYIDDLPLFSSVRAKNKKTDTKKFLDDLSEEVKKDLKIKPKNSAQPKKTSSNNQECPNIFTQRSLANAYNHADLNKETISINISNAATALETLELISKLSKVEIHVSPSITGSFGKQNFKDKTVGQILQHLLPYHSPPLSIIKDRGGFQITEEYKAKEILAETTDKFDTECFILKCADPSDTLKEEIVCFWKMITLKDKCTELCIQGNKVLARGRNHHLDQLASYIDQIDITTTQVKIDIVLASTDKQYGLDFGINWSGIYNRSNTIKLQHSPFSFAGMGGTLKDIPKPTEPISEHYGNLYVDPNHFGINLSNNIFSNLLNCAIGGNTVTIPMVFGGPDLNLARLNLMINAAEAEYKIKVFQRPTLVTLDKQTVTLSLGRSIPIITNIQDSVDSTVRTVSTFNYRDIGINIKITPIISPDKKSVSLDLIIENSELSSGSTRVSPTGVQTDPPVFESLKMNNRIQLCNQQTAIIGGLSRSSEILSKKRVPIISSLPVVGQLFKSSSNAQQDAETFIFITPTIICPACPT